MEGTLGGLKDISFKPHVGFVKTGQITGGLSAISPKGKKKHHKINVGCVWIELIFAEIEN